GTASSGIRAHSRESGDSVEPRSARQAHPPACRIVVSSKMHITTIRAAIRTALGIGLLASVAVGVLGTSNSGAGVKQIFVKACGGDKALQADPPAFSRCMRPLPPWAD